MTPRAALGLSLVITAVVVAGMIVLGGVAPVWAVVLGVPVAVFTLLWLLVPGGVEPIWAPLPDPPGKATEHLAASLASRLSEAHEYPSRFQRRLQPRLAALALVKLRRAGIDELDDPRAPEVLGADLHRLVTDPHATLPGPAVAATLFATLEET